MLAFLKLGLRIVPGEIVLVWDNHPIHKRQRVKEFLAENPRVHRYYFPIYAPELNPVELVWIQMSEYTASFAPPNMTELCIRVNNGVARTRNSAWRLNACLAGCTLSWKQRLQ